MKNLIRNSAWFLTFGLALIAPPSIAGDEHGEHHAAPAEPKAERAATAKPAKAVVAAPEANDAKASAPQDLWADLMAGNKRFVAGKAKDRELLHTREELVAGQHPRVIVLTCADSRVSPELVFDKNLGELFVVRVAGNIADPATVGSIEYAAEHLHASMLVVMGHEKCGAVAAAASGEWMPTQNLHAIVKMINPAILKAGTGVNADDTANRQVRANVAQSAEDVVRNSPVISKLVNEGQLNVVRAVYRLKTGEVEKLPEGGQPKVATTNEPGEK